MRGPVDREKQRLNQARLLPSKKALLSEGREVLSKARACQGHRDCPGACHQDSGGQLNRGWRRPPGFQHGDWDASQAGPLDSAKGVWKESGQVEDLLSQA